MFRHKNYGLYAAISIWIVTILLSFFGVFNLPNLLLYDALVGNSSAVDKSPAKVLLIEANEQQRKAGDDLWLPLLTSLEEKGARQISFTFFPKNVSSHFYRETVRMGNVLFAQKAIISSGNSLERSLVPLPDAARGIAVNTAASLTIPSTYGVYRRQFSSIEVNNQRVNAFEVEVARQFDKQIPIVTKSSYFVDFIGGADRLPVISLERVFAGDLVPELLAGRSILIGATERESVALFVPVVDNNGMLSSLSFHGYALETLLSNQIINDAHWLIEVIFIALVIGFSFFIYQYISVTLSVWLTFVLILLYIVMTWFFLVYARIWEPVVTLCFAQLATFLVFFQRKIMLDRMVLNQVLLTLSSRVRERIFLLSFYETQDPWSQVIVMINQVLDLNRVILLERITGDHRVKEIKALNCSVSDINERRRDYERTPYSTAIAKNGPIVVHDYLQGTNSDEVEYLAPLIFSGEVLGFWAFSISSIKVSVQPNFEVIVNDFRLQIAELLYFRKQWQDSQNLTTDNVQRYLRLQVGEQVYEDLNKSISLMELRLTNLECFLDGLSTASIIYDLFGRVILVNAAMTTLLKSLGFNYSEMNALDLIKKLTGMEVGKARSLLELVVIERNSTVLPIENFDGSDKAYLFRVAPLLHNNEDSAALEDKSLPFNMIGILCELVDVTPMKQTNVIRENLTRQVYEQLSENMDTIKQEVSRVLEQQSSNKLGAEVTTIQQDVSHVVDVIQQSKSLLAKDLLSDHVDSYPIDVTVPIEDLVSEHRAIAELRGIALECYPPKEDSLVFADKVDLSLLVDAILQLLINDAVDGGSVTIEFERQDDLFMCTFSNRGFGMPDERFQQYLYGSVLLTSDEFKKIRVALHKVRKWDGLLTGSSEVGVGTQFIIKLKCLVAAKQHHH